MSRIIALDQGTTSSRAIVFARDGRVVSQAQREFPQLLPAPGVVEHDPEQIWESQLSVAKRALAEAGDEQPIAALGVTNQRETTILWERDSGKPIDHAIVWQSRITADICQRMKADGLEDVVRRKTGLLLDPYFSATKIQHLLDKHSGLRERAERGEILFGTVDSFLIWRLTGGKHHVTDVSNASRTLLFDLRTLSWDDELLKLFEVPRAMLPRVVSSSEVYGETDESLLGVKLPISGAAGDQQAATFGQACFEPGAAKNTYGTGCFLLMNTGSRPIASRNNLLTTVGWRVGDQVTYCLEGSVFIAGAVVQWLRDGLGVISESSEVESLAASVEDNGGVYFVPALVGLGAPHWDPFARGAIFGLSRGTTAAHIARAAVESMAFQSCDLLAAMQQDADSQLAELKVDGGASVNNALMQFQADLLGVKVCRPSIAETTALGAAYLAGLAVGVWNDLDDIRRQWVLEREFHSTMDDDDRQRRRRRWDKAVRRSLNWEEQE